MYIQRIQKCFDSRTRIILVQSLVLSVINYCLKIWGTTNKTQMLRAQRLQNFAAKVAKGGAKKYDHATPIIKELKWLKIENKFIYDVCSTVFKTINHKIPDWLLSLPTVGEMRSDRLSRQANLLYVPRTHTDMGAKSFNVLGPTLFNNIPLDIRNASNHSSFKQKLMLCTCVNRICKKCSAILKARKEKKGRLLM